MSLVENAKKVLIKNGKQAGKDLVEVCYDEAVVEGKEALKKAIPGQIDDAIIEMVVSALSPNLKAALLAKIDQISEG